MIHTIVVSIQIVTKLTPEQIIALDRNLQNALEENEHAWLFIKPPKAVRYYNRINRKLHKGQAIIAIALNGQSIVGSMYALLPKPDARIRAAKLKKLLVNPEFRSQGIATSLFMSLESVLREREIKNVWFYFHKDNPAIRLYEKLGYKQAHKITKRSIWIKMEKNL